MIVIIYGKINEISNKLELDIPNIHFDRRYSYKVGVRHLHIEMVPRNDNKLSDNALLSLNSNLIDRSGANTFQSLFNFWNYSKRQMIQHSRVDSPIFYPLHLYQIQNAEFSVTEAFENKSVSLKKIFIQLEIIKN